MEQSWGPDMELDNKMNKMNVFKLIIRFETLFKLDHRPQSSERWKCLYF